MSERGQEQGDGGPHPTAVVVRCHATAVAGPVGRSPLCRLIRASASWGLRALALTLTAQSSAEISQGRDETPRRGPGTCRAIHSGPPTTHWRGVCDTPLLSTGWAYAIRPYCLLPTAHCPLPTAHCPLPTAHCPLPTAHCPLPTAHCPLPTAHCPLPTRRRRCGAFAIVWRGWTRPSGPRGAWRG